MLEIKQNTNDLKNTLIPLIYDNNSILLRTLKNQDFLWWLKLVDLYSQGYHTTLEGKLLFESILLHRAPPRLTTSPKKKLPLSLEKINQLLSNYLKESSAICATVSLKADQNKQSFPCRPRHGSGRETCFARKGKLPEGVAGKDLVLWGKNLGSMVGTGRLTKIERSKINLAPFQFSVIIGLLLSDGWLTWSSPQSLNARLGFQQSLDHSTYVLYVFNLLSRAPALPRTASRRPIRM